MFIEVSLFQGISPALKNVPNTLATVKVKILINSETDIQTLQLYLFIK